MKYNKVVLSTVVTLALALVVVPIALASNGVILWQNFHRIVYKTPASSSNYPLWVINFGDLGQYYGVPCGDASCVTRESSGGVDYAKLAVIPDSTPGNYSNAELAEERTGFAYGQSTSLPTYGHPVYFVSRAKFSSNYLPNGGGGAVGTAGLWQWNSPFDFQDPENPIFYAVDAIGFTWIQQGGLPAEGLTATVFQNTVPVYANPVSVSMNQWRTYIVEWSVNENGQQRVRYWVGNTSVGDYTLDQPLPAMSTELWDDNQYNHFDENWNFVTDYLNPTEQQYLLIDKVLVFQPNGFVTPAEAEAQLGSSDN